MRRAALLCCACAISALPAAAVGPRPGGAVVIAAPVDCPNYWFVCPSGAAIVVNQVIGGAFRVGPDLTYRPELITRARVSTSPFAVTYFIRPEASWSDGVPVSARDFLFTSQVFRNRANATEDVAVPYRAVKSVQILGPKVVKVVFRARYAAWRDLFHSVLPQHALAGQDVTSFWTDGIDDPHTGAPISDGPFLLTSFVPGDHLTVVRNPEYWGAHRAFLDRVVVRSADDFPAQIEELRGGRADAISPQPVPEVDRLRGRAGLTVSTRLGTSFEHLLFRLGSGGNPLLRRLFVRQAIAYGIDRTALVRRLFGRVVRSPQPLQNMIFVPNGRFYERHWDAYRPQPARVRALLQGHGCRRATDGIYACGGERLSFRLATTAGNTTREATFSILRAQLQRVGIEVVPVFAAPPVFFRQVLQGHDFDLALFTWVNTPDPGYAVEIWRCGGSDNYSGYCNPRLSRTLVGSNGVLDEAQRAAAVNRVDAQLARDLPGIPLYQKPTIVAYKTRLHGIVVNPTDETWTWNLGDWWLSSSAS
jgi:peptide/nickel transport system substrate-binding protein